MKIKLITQIEDNRWIIKFVDGPRQDRQGDYRLVNSPEIPNFKPGDIVEAMDGMGPLPPSIHYHCGRLILRQPQPQLPHLRPQWT